MEEEEFAGAVVEGDEAEEDDEGEEEAEETEDDTLEGEFGGILDLGGSFGDGAEVDAKRGIAEETSAATETGGKDEEENDGDEEKC
jgi:hypothetical protein